MTPRPHTPGPWQVIDGAVYAPWSTPAPFTGTDGTPHPNYHTGLVALIYGTLYHSGAPDAVEDGDKDANARLIAAAPELLAAARALVNEADCFHDDQLRYVEVARPVVEALRAAIASAEGRTP